MDYTVSWHIQVEADSFEDAGRQAMGMMRDPQSTATIFSIETDKHYCVLDMEDLDDPLYIKPVIPLTWEEY